MSKRTEVRYIGGKKAIWTRNFTIITAGSAVSLIGNAVSGFAIGILVLDYTNSPFLYALYLVVYNLPKMLSPVLAGPYLDRFSRKKVIYSLDFFSSAIYILMWFFTSEGIFSYAVFLAAIMLIGTVDSVYSVAFDSLYPNLVEKSNLPKAYSVSSVLHSLASMVVPIASFVYNYTGLSALFLFNAATFFTAALCETQIKYSESHASLKKRLSLKEYCDDFKEGVKYISNEKGIFLITAYVTVSMFAGGGIRTLLLPFFKSNAGLFEGIAAYLPNADSAGVTVFTLVTFMGVFGRVAGGFVNYRLRIPMNKRYVTAVCVYALIAVLQGVYLLFPIWAMLVAFFIVGIAGVTSYNIRISATQAYIPDTVRGRFMGAFQMICAAGTVLGQLLSGVLAELFEQRAAAAVFSFINLAGILLIIVRGKIHVVKIYEYKYRMGREMSNVKI